jgi:hypothetical protein
MTTRIARNPLKPDGCSLSPDFGFRHCCDLHDLLYFVGGDRSDRRAADRHLRECIRGQGHPLLAWVYWLAVRTLGGPSWPRLPRAIPSHEALASLDRFAPAELAYLEKLDLADRSN